MVAISSHVQYVFVFLSDREKAIRDKLVVINPRSVQLTPPLHATIVLHMLKLPAYLLVLVMQSEPTMFCLVSLDCRAQKV